MGKLFWDITYHQQFPIPQSEIFDYSNDGQLITRAKLSKEVMKASIYELFWRQYVSKEVDFSGRQGNHTLKIKNVSKVHEDLWEEVEEFEPYSTAQPKFKLMSIEVKERGKALFWTERAELMTAVDIVEQIKAYAKDIIVESLNTDLAKAFLYLDILAVCKSGVDVGTNKVVIGKSLLKETTFSVYADHPVVIQQATATADTVEGETLGPLTMNNILNLVVKLSTDRLVPSRNGSGYGNYTIILNRQAYARLMQDPTYREVVMRSEPDRIYSGYIGNFYGQEFVVDTSGAIDRILSNPDFAGNNAQYYTGKSIAILISKTPVMEAVLLPEQITETEKRDYGRYKAFAVKTYRGETPTWFASADGVGSGAVLIGL